MIDIYTDGACSGNPGPGGWGAIVVQNGQDLELKGGDPQTTNNRMEMMAAIEGLASVPKGSQVRLHSDSQYLVKTMTLGWKRRVNNDLWDKLDALVRNRQIEWVWVRGHAGHPQNERADRLAVSMIGQAGSKKKEPEPSHFNAASGEVHMVDVSEKKSTHRTAIAKGSVRMAPETLALIRENQIAKGDVLSVAQIAGIMAAKKTSDLIPLCHPLRITDVAVNFELNEADSTIEITATARASDKTGVEMEALTAVSISALTIYDMCKAVDRGMRIEGVRMVHKEGGKSGVITLE